MNGNFLINVPITFRVVNNSSAFQPTSIAVAQPADTQMGEQGLDVEDKCPTCGRPFHPIEAIRSLRPELKSAFPIPSSETSQSKPTKRRRIIRTARCMTTDDMMSHVRDREQQKQKPKKSTKNEAKAGKNYQRAQIEGELVNHNSSISSIYISYISHELIL